MMNPSEVWEGRRTETTHVYSLDNIAPMANNPFGVRDDEDIEAPTAMDTLISLGYSFDFIIDKAATLLELNYIFPVTVNSLKWVSSCFSQTEREETLEQHSLLVIDLFDKIFSTLEQREYFRCVYQQIIDQKVNLHPTLKWIIISVARKNFRMSKQ